MLPQLCFFVSIVFAFIAWGIVVTRYVWPKLRVMPPVEALRRILIFHSFRFVGLAFLVHGVVSPELPSGFADPAAYGDIAAATLALLSLATLPSRTGLAITWIFNVWGSFDLLSAFYYGAEAGLVPGQLGATFFIPTLLVPLMLITHGLAFRILLRRQTRAAQPPASSSRERLQNPVTVRTAGAP